MSVGGAHPIRTGQEHAPHSFGVGVAEKSGGRPENRRTSPRGTSMMKVRSRTPAAPWQCESRRLRGNHARQTKPGPPAPNEASGLGGKQGRVCRTRCRYGSGDSMPCTKRRTKPLSPAPNEASGMWGNLRRACWAGSPFTAPNEASFPAPNEASGKLGKAPNEANGPRRTKPVSSAPNEANSPAPNEASSQ
jgi:hypothetical protein